MSEKWTFDNYGYENPRPDNNVEVTDSKYGKKLTVTVDNIKEMEINADLDQWGTWITFKMGDNEFTVAQEGDTRSFIDGLIKGLTAIKDVCDCGPPIEATYSKTDEAVK